ncbi:chromosome partitioning protein ParA [Zoogloea oryzae]|uniref:Chromosome partitioning protein ParA n=1 Tax=Zoogloea oryzae TaxID=310767 RepID=A0ABQ6FG28_9RHOO|nr:ParA family protein [Zoogloea oryzae]GLT24595.1 chromosome partitioning protein ParA [Zoogloea oryzae]
MKVLSLINMKGGVAKTTLAINIADCLARRHASRVLIIDVDPQFNATQCLMDPESYVNHLKDGKDTILTVFDRTKRPVASAVAHSSKLEPKQLENISVVKIKNNLHLLPGNLELYRLEMAPGDGRENRLKNYLQKIEGQYDFVVIDTPPTPSVWMTSALIASDHYLIPVRPDPISLTGIDLLRSIIEEKKENFDLNITCAGLVLTVTEENTVVFANAKRNLQSDDYWQKFLFKSTLPKRTRIAQGQLDQIQILDGENNESKAFITSITTELLNRMD